MVNELGLTAEVQAWILFWHSATSMVAQAKANGHKLYTLTSVRKIADMSLFIQPSRSKFCLFLGVGVCVHRIETML